MKKTDVSFITINYNSSNYTIALLKSILLFTKINFEIIIVDNASKKEDFKNLAKFVEGQEQIQLIRNKINSGFASANMLGVNYANGEYYFFINNNTKLLNAAADIMKLYLDEHQDISLATAKVNDENNNFSSSYKLFPSLTKELFGNAIARKFSKHNFPSNKMKLNEPTLVEVVSGSCMFFRKSTFCEIGGFDTGFFLYCEEEDISKRVWENGSKVIFLPEAEIFHASGGSTTQSYDIEKEYYISYNFLLNKHFNILEKIILKSLLFFKLFRRIFKRKNGYKLFLFAIKGFDKNQSLRYKQKVICND